MFISKIVNSRSLNPNTLEYWDKTEVEVTLNENDNPNEANALSQSKVIEYQALMPKPQERVIETKKTNGNSSDNLPEAINSCTDLKILETYKLLARFNPFAQEAYDKKYLELSK